MKLEFDFGGSLKLVEARGWFLEPRWDHPNSQPEYMVEEIWEDSYRYVSRQWYFPPCPQKVEGAFLEKELLYICVKRKEET